MRDRRSYMAIGCAAVALTAAPATVASAKVMTRGQANQTMKSEAKAAVQVLQDASDPPFSGVVGSVTNQRTWCNKPKRATVKTDCFGAWDVQWKAIADGRDLGAGRCAAQVRVAYRSRSRKARKVTARFVSFTCDPEPKATTLPAAASPLGPVVPAQPLPGGTAPDTAPGGGVPAPGAPPVPPSATGSRQKTRTLSQQSALVFKGCYGMDGIRPDIAAALRQSFPGWYFGLCDWYYGTGGTMADRWFYWNGSQWVVWFERYFDYGPGGCGDIACTVP